jgi:hypothetical protein
LRLDVRRWQREGILESGAIGLWQWRNTETGEKTSSIGYVGGGDHVQLRYTSNGKATNQRVLIESTACNYGGTRPWFICPIRGERVAMLYFRAGRFACRLCQRLAYTSQSEDEVGRNWRRQGKLEARLGEHWSRPKGMHRATHDQLKAQIFDYEWRRDELIAHFLVSRFGVQLHETL